MEKLKNITCSWANLRKQSELKRCPKCGRVLPTSDFYARSNGKGLQSWCKDCCKERGRRRNGTTGIYRPEETINISGTMNDIQIFNNPQFGDIRTAGTPDEPVFCLADVCNAIGITNARNVKSRLDTEDVRLVDTLTAGGTQQVTFVTESGLYDVIIRSDSEKAKPFRRWVTSEVLPSIRKHGAYATTATIESIIADPDNGIRLLQALKESNEKARQEREQRIAAEGRVMQLEGEATENRPKVIYADAVAGSTSSCLIGELAKMISQNGYQIGEKRLFEWLRDNHYLCSYGERYNQPYQQYVEQGLFTMKQNVFSVNGEMRTRNTTKVTGKGQIYFINKFLGVR